MLRQNRCDKQYPSAVEDFRIFLDFLCLNPFPITNFLQFQIERFRRQQFKLDVNCGEFSKKGRKHCEKLRNGSL